MSESQLSNNDLYSKLLSAINQQGEVIKKDIKEYIKIENAKITKVLEEQNKKIEILEKKYNDIESNQLNLERLMRKNNIVIFGLEVKLEQNLCQTVLKKLNEILEINLKEEDLNNIYTIKTDKGIPIKIEFLSYLKKSLIFKNIHKLKNTQIFIANDLCYKDRIQLKILQKHQKLAKSKNLPTKIIGQKLLVNGEFFTADQLEDSVGHCEFEEFVSEESEEKRKSISAPSSPCPNSGSGTEENSLASEESQLRKRPNDQKPVVDVGKSINSRAAMKTRLQSLSKSKN